MSQVSSGSQGHGRILLVVHIASYTHIHLNFMHLPILLRFVSAIVLLPIVSDGACTVYTVHSKRAKSAAKAKIVT